QQGVLERKERSATAALQQTLRRSRVPRLVASGGSGQASLGRGLGMDAQAAAYLATLRRAVLCAIRYRKAGARAGRFSRLGAILAAIARRSAYETADGARP